MTVRFAAAPLPEGRFTWERRPFLWILEREVVRYLRIWRFSIAGPILSTVLFVIVFGTVLGNHIDAVGDIPFGQFIVPGLVTQAVVNVGFYNGTTSLFEARRDEYIHDVFASPIRLGEYNAALVLAAVFRGIFTGGVSFVIAALLTGVGVARPGYLLVAAAGVLLVAAQFGIICGTLSNSLDAIYSMESLVLLPLGFFGGIFYPLSQLAGPWAMISHLDPFFWLVQAAKIGFLGAGEANAWLVVGVVWASGIVLSGWSSWLFAHSRNLKP